MEFSSRIAGPLHIVMTPVRNEAWVLRAFLESTTRWADYIIIADQMSTDGSRDIAREYEKVILIDNRDPNFNEAERQAMLIKKAREVADGRDTLLWGLDADEILSANFRETDDWKHILNSVPGDVFWFRWAEICPDKEHYWLSNNYYPWLFHDDGKEPHGNYVRNMHSMRIPYPIEEKQMFYVEDFKVLHLAYLNPFRTDSKRRFYTFIDWEMNHRSPFSLARAYSQNKKDDLVLDLPQEFIPTSTNNGFDIWDHINTDGKLFWFDNYIVERIANHPTSKIRKLPIWDDTFIHEYQIIDPRRPIDRIVHSYLHKTAYKKGVIIKLIDKIGKILY